MARNITKLKILYWIMYRLMDIESLLWWLADFIVYPTALLRRHVAKVIKNNL